MREEDDVQSAQWESLYEQTVGALRQFGREDAFGGADFWVIDDNWGSRQQKVLINNLEMLRPVVVERLQRLLVEFPSWEIVVAVALRGPGESWPEMGLIVRTQEIIDGLQRRYFPVEYRELRYKGSRPGTDRD